MAENEARGARAIPRSHAMLHAACTWPPRP